MKKKFGTMLFAGLMVVQGGVTTFAAEVPATEGDGQNATSYAHVSLLKSDVVDPTDPILPVDPEDPDGGETGNTGALRIDYVSSFEFGSYELSNKTEVYTLEDYNKNPFVQVSDFRGTGEGWTLQVSGSEFRDNETGNTLKGAELAIPSGIVQGANSVSNAPKSQAAIVTSSPSTVMSAGEGEGMGTWADEFNRNEVKLTVPSGNYTGDYQATLTWTLTDALQ